MSARTKLLALMGANRSLAERVADEILSDHAHELAEDLRQYAEQQDNEQRHDGVQSAADRIDPEFDDEEDER